MQLLDKIRPPQRPAMRRNRLGHIIRLALVALPLLWFAQRAIFGMNGLRALWHTQQQYKQTMTQVHQLEEQNRTLNQAVRQLQTNPESIETIAREQLHLTKPGEIIYTYPVKPNAGTSAASLRR
ncbi:MAG: septum formation initiator family protein [Acidobacteria bacterium]|nr:MAG: septum formation initiator family protein [Acidobacteriota bacterium]